MDIKSGHLKGKANVFGLKLVSWFGDNIEKGLPDVIGTIMVFEKIAKEKGLGTVVEL